MIHISENWTYEGKTASFMHVTETSEGKDLPLTRSAISCATQQQRLLYARKALELIERDGRPQKEIADAAGVTARSLRNMRDGMAPQADKLAALFIALNVDIDGEAESEVSPYTRMLAPVIRRIHPDHRDAAVSEAIGLLSDAALQHPYAARIAPVTQLRPNVGDQRDDREAANDTINEERPDTDDDYTP